MSEKIEPALTAEEWEGKPCIAGWDDGSVFLSTEAIQGETDVSRPHAIAALALHGQPFGFTRDDVRDLEAAAHSSPSPFAVRLGNLANRIEALLRPEST